MGGGFYDYRSQIWHEDNDDLPSDLHQPLPFHVFNQPAVLPTNGGQITLVAAEVPRRDLNHPLPQSAIVHPAALPTTGPLVTDHGTWPYYGGPALNFPPGGTSPPDPWVRVSTMTGPRSGSKITMTCLLIYTNPCLFLSSTSPPSRSLLGDR